jgi:hypothetical protein
MDYVKEKNNNLYDFVIKDIYIYIALKKEEFNNEINIIDLGNKSHFITSVFDKIIFMLKKNEEKSFSKF